MTIDDRAPSADTLPDLGDDVRVHFEALTKRLSELAPVIVAFSGGADSALLAWAAHWAASSRAVAVTAVSPSLAEDEYEHCKDLAERWGLDWRPITTVEMDNPAYLRNDADRCFHCKSALMDAVEPVAESLGATVILGVNVDDLGDHRPGQRAAAERGAVFPFVDVGMTKAEVRELSRQLGLQTWDKPAAPCLASRLPYGTPVTMRRLSQVEQAERVLRREGFGDARVRHYDDTARIEVPEEDLAKILGARKIITAELHRIGFGWVTVDLDGLQSGNLNRVLDQTNAERPDG